VERILASKPIRKTRALRSDAARDIQPHAAQAAALLKALANEQRLMILCTLIGGPLSVSELNERVALSQSALSQHLAVLREANIVATAREAQIIRYTLPAGIATEIITLLHREFCAS
jgi:DNA-binding transcriptional ArsR family regulator